MARAYRVPGGNVGMWIASLIGIVGAIFVFIVGFFPEGDLDKKHMIYYEIFLGLGIIVFCAIPFLILKFKKPSWDMPAVNSSADE